MIAKKFALPVRWEFKIAVHGYGRNVKEALLDAASRLETQTESDFGNSDFEAIELHEVVSVNERDYLI